MHRKPAYLVAGVCLAAVLGLSAQASARTIKGTVVHRNSKAGSFVVAGRRGQLSAIHTSHSPSAGAVVAVSARKLSNGTFAAKHVRKHGRRHHAHITGTVTWTGAHGFTVSARGASLLVHRSSDDSTPQVGDQVNVGVTVGDNGDLDEDNLDQAGDQQNTMELEGSVLSIDTSANTITVSADDCDKSGGSVVVHVPDASKFTVGDEVELTVSGPAADGSFTLIAADEDNNDEQDGNDDGDHQGQDGGGDHQGGPGGDDHSGSGGGGGGDD
jgi:hypothetical protein